MPNLLLDSSAPIERCFAFLAVAFLLACSPGSDASPPGPDASPPGLDASPGTGECPDDPIYGESPVECIDWEKVAEDHGFITRPDDFFEFLQYGCSVETSVASATLEDLVNISDTIFLGRLVEVVPVSNGGTAGMDLDYLVHLQVAIDDEVKGASVDELEVGANCGTAGKIAGLQYSLPDDTFLFFLEAADGPEAQTLYFLSYFYLGVVEDTSDGPQFALQAEGEIAPPPLDDYRSIEELAEAVGNL